jgi:hypothetical protein
MASRFCAALAEFRRFGRAGSRYQSSGSPLPTPATYGTPASAGTPESDAVSASSSRIAVDAVASSLVRFGYAVVDGALDGTMDTDIGTNDATLAETLRSELISLASTPGLMRPNATVLVHDTGTRSRLPKRNIFEAELHALDESTLRSVPALRAVSEDRSLLTLLNIALPSHAQNQLHYQVVKVQRNAGFGGCFPLHFDSDEDVDSRRITALTYLNPDWRRGDGGELVLYPFPVSEPVLIEPKMGRVVLFSASNMCHRVLPSLGKERLCFTRWFFGKANALGSAAAARDGPSPRAAPDPASGDASSLAWSQARALCRPHLRKHLARVVLNETWTESIEQAHADSEARGRMVRTHRDETAIIARALAGTYPEGIRLLARIAESGTEEEKDKLGVTWL